MKANELIVKAYYLSEIVSRGLEEVSGSQMADGLEMLNDIITEKSAKGYEIPYYETRSFSTVTGQEKYFVDDLINISTVTFTSNNVRYPVELFKRKEYKGNGRVEGVQSLIYNCYVERALGGANLYFYPLPADVYLVEVTSKYALSEVTGNEELSDTKEKYYQGYLKYALAERICDFYNIEFSPGKMKTLMKKERDIFNVDPPDMTIKKLSTLNSDDNAEYLSYPWANLSGGWFPNR